MYALAGLRDFDTPVEELRDLLGWKSTRNIMRFQAFNTVEADLLERHFSLEPRTPPPSGGDGPAGRPPVLAGVHSDTASGEDLLSNEADVEMLAQLAAATVTTLPLAVALLGEWGAGKSSFIRQMSSRVDQLAALAAEDPAHSAFTDTVRQVHDLVQLDERLREARAEWAGAHSRQLPPLERIVLYIDDLDRCPPARVVEVLAAVHLMLALPLFVVVVAVDPRWLLTSLEHHYRELFTSRDSTPGWADTQDIATPLDYLDKIFQIPFAVPPTTREKAARLIRALLTTPDIPGPEGPAQPADPGGLPDAEESEAPTPLTVSVPAPEPAVDLTPGPRPDRTPVQLQLEETEIAFMSQMGGLTRTPRAAKKLVNLCRLARIGVDPGDLAAFVGTEAIPGGHQVVQILLALLVGSPDQAATVFRHILEAPPTSKVTEALRDLPADVPAGAQAADLIEQMTTGRPVVMDTAVYQQWCPKLARFSFYTRNLTG
jgi:hypothetical protein